MHLTGLIYHYQVSYLIPNINLVGLALLSSQYIKKDNTVDKEIIDA